MKLRSILCMGLILGSFAATPSWAADGMAIVNIQQIMHDSTAAQSVKQQLDTKQKAFQAEMTKKEQELQKEEQELGKQRSVLSQEAFEKKVKEFRIKADAAQKDVQGKRAQLDNAFSASFSEIQKSLVDIVSKIAKDKGYSTVIPASQALYYDSKLDITQEVLGKLNSSLPKVAVNFKASTKSSSDE